MASMSLASRGRHECFVLQCGQRVSTTSFGMVAKVSLSVSMPVEMSRPVLGHLMIRTPMKAVSVS